MSNEILLSRYNRLIAKVSAMRALEDKKQKLRNYFPVQDKNKLYRLQKEVDDLVEKDANILKTNPNYLF